MLCQKQFKFMISLVSLQFSLHFSVRTRRVLSYRIHLFVCLLFKITESVITLWLIAKLSQPIAMLNAFTLHESNAVYAVGSTE